MTDVPHGEDSADRNVVRLAEYNALRVEIERRANIQWSVTALQFTTAATVAGLAISRASDFALLLLIPLLSYMFGTRYILHDFHIRLITQYLRESLSERLNNELQWDEWYDAKYVRRDNRRLVSVTGWLPTQSTRLAFEGIATLALAAAAIAASYRVITGNYPWYAIVGFSICWLLDFGTSYYCTTTLKTPGARTHCHHREASSWFSADHPAAVRAPLGYASHPGLPNLLRSGVDNCGLKRAGDAHGALRLQIAEPPARRRSCQAPVGAGRFVIRATRERGVGVPPSRRLGNGIREASQSLSEATDGACVTVQVTANAAGW